MHIAAFNGNRHFNSEASLINLHYAVICDCAQWRKYGSTEFGVSQQFPANIQLQSCREGERHVEADATRQAGPSEALWSRLHALRLAPRHLISLPLPGAGGSNYYNHLESPIS